MLQRLVQRKFISYVERVLILFLALAVLLRANVTRMPSGMEQFLSARFTLLNTLGAIVFLWGWELCFHELNNEDSRERSLWQTVVRVSHGSLFATCLLAVILLIAKVHTPLASVLPSFFCVAMVLVFTRLSLEWLVENRAGNEHLQVVIVGTGPLARQAWKELRTKHYRAAIVKGFVDNEIAMGACPEIRGKYLGRIDDLQEILLHTVVDCIVVAMPARSCYLSIQQAITIGEQVGIDLMHYDTVFHVSRAFGSAQVRPKLRAYIEPCPKHALRQTVKRGIDIALAGYGLLILSPLLLAIAIAIKFTSPGPVFFIQRRYGYRRRMFKLLKFRTMVVNAEEMLENLEKHNEAVGPIFKIRSDPRVTPIGRILRKTSLDEMPQLWNVLTGSMSLVGPRPMSIRDVSLFSDAYLMRRFRVKPGITGLWQVSGRSNTTFDHWIAMDFRYIDNWSLLLDFQILLRTVPAVLKGSGAI
jgi:exopolysaccharide biosynthesis polyprenyl glycosylphosphotransferase